MRTPRLLVLLLVAGCGTSLTPSPGPVEVARLGAPAGELGSFTFACGAVPDGQGGLYLALDTDTGLDGPLRGLRDLAVARLGPDGAVRWVRQLGDEGTVAPLFTRGCALATDEAGAVYAAGLVNGRGHFRGEALPAAFTALAAAWAPDGTPRWHRLLGGTGGAEAMGVTAADGEVRVLGYAQGGLEGQAGLGLGDAFLARLDPATGAPRAVRVLGGPQEDVPAGLHPGGLAYVTTEGIRGPAQAAVHHPLGRDGGLGPAAALSPGLELVAAVQGQGLVTVSSGGEGQDLLVRRLDERGEPHAITSLPALPGGTVRALACGPDGCALVLTSAAVTVALWLDAALVVRAEARLPAPDGGAAPLVRAAALMGDEVWLAGSRTLAGRGEAVVWRWTPGD